MTNFDVYREFESGLTDEELKGAVERSRETIEEMRGEGESISYLGSQVFAGADDLAHATMCRYDAASEDVVRDHSERSGLPMRNVYRRGTSLEGIAPEAGVAAKVA